MIVPTTILSLAALSAAESNSSGNRGLRKSSTPWTAIAVVSGTAVTGVVIGGVIGWFSHSATGSGSCPTGYDCPAPLKPTKCLKTAYLSTTKTAAVAAVCTVCTGNTQVDTVQEFTSPVGTAEDCNRCLNTAWLKTAYAAAAGASPAVEAVCEPCTGNKAVGRGTAIIGTAHDNEAAACLKCADSYYPKAGAGADDPTTCVKCPSGELMTPGNLIALTHTTTAATACKA